MLNYGYTVLRGLVIRSIVKKGLDPRISFFHISFSNYFALASDIMEPFRPLVDQIAFKYRKAEIFNLIIRDELVNIINTKLLIENKKHFLPRAIDIIIDRIIGQQKWVNVELCV